MGTPDAGLSMWVTVDRRRVLERFSSDDLLSEVAARKSVALPEDKQSRQDALMNTISEAVDCLRSGRADDALLTLERGAFPKFKSFDQATALYLKQVKL
jgi:hypothetical protein